MSWWMRTHTTLVDCVAWQVLCSERLTTRMVETSMNKLFQVHACSDCKIPRLPHGHGCESSRLVPKPFGSLGIASPVFGSKAQGIEFWAHGDGSFRQFSRCLGGNN